MHLLGKNCAHVVSSTVTCSSKHRVSCTVCGRLLTCTFRASLFFRSMVCVAGFLFSTICASNYRSRLENDKTKRETHHLRYNCRKSTQGCHHTVFAELSRSGFHVFASYYRCRLKNEKTKRETHHLQFNFPATAWPDSRFHV